MKVMIGPATLYLGDCLDVLRGTPDNSIDAIVTDPPYGLKFMGRKWDYDVPSVEIWAECLRVAKPGAHLLSFAGTRTQHRMACRIEDAGWEIRDMIAWLYGSGFPKSLDVGKAIDKAAGVGVSADGYVPNGKNNTHVSGWGGGRKTAPTTPATPAAAQWADFGTAIKPAMEPITMARKPLDGTVAANVLAYGTGALNIGGCRVEAGSDLKPVFSGAKGNKQAEYGSGTVFGNSGKYESVVSPDGRWPANVTHDGSEEVIDLFGDKARFFYCAKASKKDRGSGNTSNHHPTVKPTDLMRWLCRIVTPPGGVVLDPFMGSGSTGKAAKLEGFQFIGIDREAEYLEIARRRIEATEAQGDLNLTGGAK